MGQEDQHSIRHVFIMSCHDWCIYVWLNCNLCTALRVVNKDRNVLYKCEYSTQLRDAKRCITNKKAVELCKASLLPVYSHHHNFLLYTDFPSATNFLFMGSNVLYVSLKRVVSRSFLALCKCNIFPDTQVFSLIGEQKCSANTPLPHACSKTELLQELIPKSHMKSRQVLTNINFQIFYIKDLALLNI